MSTQKEYLGDGVYASADDFGGVVLTTEDGGPRSAAYCFYPGNRLLFTGTVGNKLPKTWAEWNVLPSWTLTHGGDAADRRWAEVSS